MKEDHEHDSDSDSDELPEVSVCKGLCHFFLHAKITRLHIHIIINTACLKLLY